jgi:hypothetical protein
VTVGTVGRAYALAKAGGWSLAKSAAAFARGAANDDTGDNVMPKPPERNTVDLVATALRSQDCARCW